VTTDSVQDSMGNQEFQSVVTFLVPFDIQLVIFSYLGNNYL
jgi:hypothetical protein